MTAGATEALIEELVQLNIKTLHQLHSDIIYDEIYLLYGYSSLQKKIISEIDIAFFEKTVLK